MSAVKNIEINVQLWKEASVYAKLTSTDAKLYKKDVLDLALRYYLGLNVEKFEEAVKPYGKNVNIAVNPETWKLVGVKAILLGVDIRDVVNTALRLFLDAEKAKQYQSDSSQEHAVTTDSPTVVPDVIEDSSSEAEAL